MLKTLSDFRGANDKAWLTIGFGGAMIFPMVLVVSASAFQHAMPGDWVLLAILGLVVLFAGGGVVLAARQDEAQRVRYAAYLATQPLPILLAARTSPELGSDSKDVITEWLNKNHPGWSMPTSA